MTILVVFLLDAARPDYVQSSTMPYLSKLSEKKGLTVLRPSFGFCERAEIFTGTEPMENGFFTAIGYDPSHSEFNKYRWFLWVAQIFEMKPFQMFSGLVRKLIRRFFLLMGVGMNCYHIPYKFLRLFALTEDSNEGVHFIRDHSSSILKACKNKDLRVNMDCFTSLGLPDLPSDRARLDHLKRSIDEDLADVFFVYISHCDQLGHCLGPDSEIFKKSLLELDGLLSEFSSWSETRVSKNIEMIFIGDHGMRGVVYRFDIISQIEFFSKKFPGVLECYFVDSTLCRFWFKEVEATNTFREWINASPQFLELGVLVSCSEYEQYGIPNISRKYGDLIWIANHGVVLQPNFFDGQESCLKGMHGYVPEGIDDCGFVMSNFMKLDDNEFKLIDVNKILRAAIDRK